MHTTTIQILVLHSNTTFDQPATPAGRQWKVALSYLATCPGWCGTFWGRHFEIPEKVTLFQDLNHSSNVQTFLTAYYDSFVALLSPLLAAPPEPPYIVKLSTACAQPADLPLHGGLTTFSRMTFNSLSAEERDKMSVSTTFLLYDQDMCSSCREEGVVKGFRGAAASWTVDPVTWKKTATLWMMTDWDSLEDEQRIEKTVLGDNGQTLKEKSLGDILNRADPGMEVHHVAWELLTPQILKWWMDSENPRWPYEPLKDGDES